MAVPLQDEERFVAEVDGADPELQTIRLKFGELPSFAISDGIVDASIETAA